MATVVDMLQKATAKQPTRSLSFLSPQNTTTFPVLALANVHTCRDLTHQEAHRRVEGVAAMQAGPVRLKLPSGRPQCFQNALMDRTAFIIAAFISHTLRDGHRRAQWQ